MTAERNTPGAIVFDMEQPLTRLQAELNVLEELTKEYKNIGATDNQTAVDWTLAGVVMSADQVREYWKRLFDAIRRPEKAAADAAAAGHVDPEPAKGFDAIFAEWNTNRKQQGEGPYEMSDAQAERLNAQESVLVDKIVATPATSAGEIAAKVFVAKKLIEEGGSRWSDERDVKVLGSVMEDLTRLGASKPAA